MSNKPKAPENLFVNFTPDYAVIVWDKVIKNLDNEYTDIIAYYVYRSDNPTNINWSLLKRINTKDLFGEVDTFFIDWSVVNRYYMYKVCAENSLGIGACAISYGIIGSGEPIDIDNYLIWNQGKWDEKLWK